MQEPLTLSDYYERSVAFTDIQCHLPCFLHLEFITFRHYT